jgi:hypothetical protein
MKLAFDAEDKKEGMTLAEITKHVNTFGKAYEAAGYKADAVKIRIVINFSGGIKTLSAEA